MQSHAHRCPEYRDASANRLSLFFSSRISKISWQLCKRSKVQISLASTTRGIGDRVAFAFFQKEKYILLAFLSSLSYEDYLCFLGGVHKFLLMLAC